MPIIPLPDQGIEVRLSEYNRLRAFQGGGWFWDHDNQQVIREMLGDFLPRVEERRDRGGALFQHFVGATEAASRSQAVGAQMNRVPRAEFNRLQRALENLKRKAQDPNTDPNARRVIEKFCLPDPAKDPDLYRVYGSSWNRRLLVLWGCEREEGTSLAPAAALNKIAVEPPTAAWLRRLPFLFGWTLLVAVLLVALFLWWQQHHEQTRKESVAATFVPPAIVPPNPGGDPGRATAGHPEAGTLITRRVPGNSSDTIPSARYPQAPSSGAASGFSANEAQTPGGKDFDPSTINPTDGRIDRDSKSGTDVMNQPGHVQADSSTDRNRLGTAEPGESKGARTLEQRQNTVRSTDESTGKNATPSTLSPDLPAGPGKTKAPSPSAAARTATPPKLDILKADGSNALHDGKMDTVLLATARDDDGMAVPLTIAGWSVDGTASHDPAGHDVTTSQLNLTLAPGKHRVSVSGTARGLPVDYETEVTVQIKSEGDVTVKPRESK